uniref:Uncharacterized protein n=1 Tax=Parastrongyloides trichosuri TaxID=131310 RepID=A0A0N4ZIR6_PARTI
MKYVKNGLSYNSQNPSLRHNKERSFINNYNESTQTYIVPEIESYKCCYLFSIRYTCGLKIFLIFYIILTIFGFCFGMSSTLIWLIIPISVVITTLIGITQKKHRYLYPFLIITVVHLIVSITMAILVLLCMKYYETIIYYSQKKSQCNMKMDQHSMQLSSFQKTNVVSEYPFSSNRDRYSIPHL